MADMTPAEQVAYLRGMAEQRHWLEPFRGNVFAVCDLAAAALRYVNTVDAQYAAGGRDVDAGKARKAAFNALAKACRG